MAIAIAEVLLYAFGSVFYGVEVGVAFGSTLAEVGVDALGSILLTFFSYSIILVSSLTKSAMKSLSARSNASTPLVTFFYSSATYFSMTPTYLTTSFWSFSA